MNAIANIIERASKLNGTVVLPEGQDPRVITAACACVERKLATPVVLGTAAEIADAEAKAGKKLADFGIAVIDYTTGLTVPAASRCAGDGQPTPSASAATRDASGTVDLLDDLAKAYHEAWNAKEAK